MYIAFWSLGKRSMGRAMGRSQFGSQVIQMVFKAMRLEVIFKGVSVYRLGNKVRV